LKSADKGKEPVNGGFFPMLTYQKMKKKPNQFRSFTGITLDEFERLFAGLQEKHEKFNHKRLSHRKRQRVVGAGRTFKHDLATRVILCLVHLRLNLTVAVMGYLFDLDQANISRNLTQMRSFLKRKLPEPSCIKKGKKINSLEELYRLYPDLEALVDGTEQPIQRPKDSEKQKIYYSGKKKRHTIKKQLVVNHQGLIMDVSQAVEGKRHDFKLFGDHQTLPEVIPKEVEVLADSGYQGAEKLYPDRRIRLPIKATKLRPLTDAQKADNRALSKVRVQVEHAIGRLKRFKILSDRFRHRLCLYDEIFDTVAGLVNFTRAQNLGLSIP
jgi:hypothetical protein